jgi:hypothetical protein
MSLSSKTYPIKDLTVNDGSSPIQIDTGNFTLPAAPADSFTYYRLTGTSTLVSTMQVTSTGTLHDKIRIRILFDAVVTVGAFGITIFGQAVPNALATQEFMAECVYDSTAIAWTVIIIPDISATSFIETGNIKDLAITEAKVADNAVTLAKMYELATGNVIFGNASNRPTALSVADSTIVVGDSSTGLVSVAVSGDATLAKTGALTIANSAVTTAKIADDAVTSAKLDDDSNRTQIVIPTSFESAGEIGVLEYKICFPCTLEAIHATVTKPFTSTGTHIFKDDTGTVITGSQIDMSSGLFLGNIVSTTPTANNTFVAGDVIKIETSVSAAVGGRSTIVLCMLKS